MRRPKPPLRKDLQAKKAAQTKPEPGTTVTSSTGWRSALLPLAIIFLITIIAFFPALRGEFITTWDDGAQITDNLKIRELNSQNIKVIFTEQHNSNYGPLTMLSWAVEYHFFKLNPFPYHLNNLLLHLLCTFLVFRLLLMFNIPLLWAFFGALLFSIHPMRVESVAWVTERKDLLYTAFYLPALMTWHHYISKPDRKWLYYSLTLLLFTLSLFSKIQAVSLPLALVLIDFYRRRPLSAASIVDKIPFFALSLVFGIMGILFLKDVGALEVNETYSLIERSIFGLFSLTVYLLKFIFPYIQSTLYPYPILPGQSFPLIYYLNLLFIPALAAAVIMTYRKTRVILFGVLFFFFNIVFVLQVLSAGSAYLVDRFTYLPYIGLWFIVVWYAARYAEKGKGIKQGLALAFAVVAVIYSGMTWQRTQVWKDSETLWTDVISKYPGKLPTAYTNRAIHYRKMKYLDRALADYNYAVRLDSTDGGARMNRGNIHFDLGNDSLAFRDYTAAMRYKINDNQKASEINKLYGNLGAIYGRKGRADSAIYYFDKALALDSTSLGAMQNKGVLMQTLGRYEEAIDLFKKYLKYEPDDHAIYSDIGVFYARLGRFQESIESLSNAIRLQPDNGLYYLNRSMSYHQMNRIENAREDARKAVSLGYPLPQGYDKMIGLNP